MKKIKEFYEKHKKAIYTGSAIVLGGIVVTVALYYKKYEIANTVNLTLRKLKDNESLEIVENLIEETTNIKEINVCDYIRKLPEGYKASQQQIDLALSKGFVLESNCTYVNSYVRNVSYEV